jgi:hypothetical protein
MYQPRPLGEAPGSVALGLAAYAHRNRLTIYAGAGISAAYPTSLPGASSLARLLLDALRDQIPLDDVDSNDLAAVADAISSEPLGHDLLRQTVLHVADLLGATVNYAHEVLGLLLCEGAVTVFETNYDDCIERGASPERPHVARTATELLSCPGRALLKVHGCATLPETMLVTTAELANAPRWAQTAISAQLGTDRVAFVGIGSPADYVRSSIRALFADVGTEHVLLVDPVLLDNWDGQPPSPWLEILPTLKSDQRDARSADEFCDALLRAYLLPPRKEARSAVAALPAGHAQRTGLEATLAALEERHATWVLRWLRGASYPLATGEPVVTSPEAVAGVLGVGALVGDEALVRLEPEGWLFVTVSGDNDSALETVPVMLMIVHGATTGARAESDGHRRVHRARANYVVKPGERVVVLVVRHMGPMSGETLVSPGNRLADVLRAGRGAGALPEDIVADAMATHIIDGTRSGEIIIVNGDRLIEAA